MKTSPARIASALRFVAEGIDNSSNPSKSLVASDLQMIAFALEGAGPEEAKRRFAETNEGLAKLLWTSEEGKDVEEAYGMARKAPMEDKLLTALQGLKSSIDDFARSLKGGKTTRQQIKEEEEAGDVVTSAPPVKRR